MRFEHMEIDVRDTNVDTVERVESELNNYAKKLEDNGYGIVSEEVQPETDSVKSYFTIVYDKGGIRGTQYIYRVYDIRDGSGIVTKLLNELTVELEEKGRRVIRFKQLPKANKAFTQVLLVHAPSAKPVSSSATNSGGVTNEKE